MSQSPAEKPSDGDRRRRSPRAPADDGAPVLPDRAAEDRDEEAWGDGPAGRDDDWYRRERPPHHA
ncbi:MAG TPA: hypothetical protein VGH01_04355 [Jatrophihabitantaceae bacterium]